MFTVRVRSDDGSLAFEDAELVLHARTPDEAATAFDRCERALDDGYWIAGYLSYELGAAFVRERIRPSATPLLALGIFAAPRTFDDRDEAFALSPPLAAQSAHAYERGIDAVRRSIYDGDVYQVNYTVPFHLALEGDAMGCWDRIARQTDAPFQAFVRDGNRTLLSWSPELFLRFEGTRIVTKPMKGTAPLDATHELANPKNRAEHVMIVDLLRNDFHRVCRDVRVTHLAQIERYPTFATMTSTIEGTLRDGAGLGEIFRATFPCGSVTGAPKRAAVREIARLETSTRDVYCGSIGYLSPERRGWWNVAIRTAQFHGAIGRFDAGGGIVSDSTSIDEWREIGIKTAFLRASAQPPEVWETFAADASAAVVERHLTRLRASAAALGIPYDEAAIRGACERLRRPNALLRLKIGADGTPRIASEPLHVPSDVRVCLARERVRSDDPFLRIKSAWRPAHDRAFADAGERACFDAILANERGELTEGSRTTFYARIDGTLWTPPLASGLLPGIGRARMLEDGLARERVLYPADLQRADALFVGNSARGLIRAHRID